MDNQSKIYIAGHTGLVGNSIYKKLIQQNYNNLISPEQRIDLRNQLETEKYIESNKPEYIFLAAAKVGGILANNTYKAEFIYDNLMISSNIIKAAYKNNVNKLLNLGSSCIYPKYAPQPIKESYLLTGELEPTNEPYAIAKIAAIKLCRYFNEQYGTNFLSVMPTNLYGGNDNFNLESSHVIAALIRKFIIAKSLEQGDYEFLKKDININPVGFGLDKFYDGSISSLIEIFSKAGIFKDKVILWGTGNVLREFLHSDDLAEACIFIIQNFNYSDIGEFINIGYGSDISIRDLANIIKEIVGFKGNIEFDSSKPDGTPRKLMDSSRIFDLGWKPRIDLESGIRREVNNYISKISAILDL